MSSWKIKLSAALATNNERWSDFECIEIYFNTKQFDIYFRLKTFVEEHTVEEIEKMSIGKKLSLEFDDSHKTLECPIQFQAWTKNNIYFSDYYDGYDFVITKARNFTRVLSHDMNSVYYKK